MDILHEGMKMNAPLAGDGGMREEEIHQHGLAAADLAKNVEALEPFGRPAEAAKQAARRAGR